MDVPAEYVEGYAKAKEVDAELAGRYIRHTTIGDPAADALIDGMHADPNPMYEGWIHRAMEGQPIDDAPDFVRNFFLGTAEIPAWFHPAKVLSGCRAFHRNSEMLIGAFVGAVLIEGFATLISKSFSITGRLVDQGVRRLKQNNRQLMEIFLPGGLDLYADGWRLSVRVRLVHARVRHLLKQSEEWETAQWGMPLSAAHIGFASAAFSALLLKRAAMLGVRLSSEERESFMMIWRYTAHLMGVVPEMLFESEDDALRLHRIAWICEPPPSMESILLANGLINSAPLVAGIENPVERRKLVKQVYRISRAMIGDKLANELSYPPSNTTGVLTMLVFKNKLQHLLHRIFPKLVQKHHHNQFQRILDLSHYSSEGSHYRMQEHLHAEKDKPL